MRLQVDVTGVDGQLKEMVNELINIHPNQEYTVGQIQEEVTNVFRSGFFTSARPHAEPVNRHGDMQITIQVLSVQTRQQGKFYRVQQCRTGESCTGCCCGRSRQHA